VAKAEPVVEVEETPVVPIQSKSRLMVLLAFSAVVLLQMIFLALILRGFSSPPPGGQQESKPLQFSIEDPPRRADLVEFPITEPFMCMIPSDDAISGFTVTAKFTLKHEKSRQSKFTTLYNSVENDIRSQIVTILRSSRIEDLNDPNCTRIRNRILQKINEIFAEPQPLVIEVIAVDFRYTPM